MTRRRPITPSPDRPGRDRRAVFCPSPQPRTGAVRRLASAVVVGGGIAGLAAATGLAERGVRVTLLEAGERLGGRVAAWPTTLADGSPVTMSRGFHAFFRQYYTLRALLRRADPDLRALRTVPDYPLLAGDGTRDSFARIPRTPPWSVLGFVVVSPSFTLRELARVNVPAALELLDVDFPSTWSRYDGEDAQTFLGRLRFPPRARHLSLEVFARSFFADPREFSAGELVAMFHTYFVGSAEGLLFDVPRDDFDTALWAPLGRYLTGLGVQIVTGSRVQAVHTEPAGRLRVRAAALGDGEGGTVRGGTVQGGVGDIAREWNVDAVVLAPDRAGLQEIVGNSPELGDAEWRRAVTAQRIAPPFAVWRLWLDRAVRAPAFLGTSGFGCLDNISRVSDFEAGARDWARRHGGSVLELHAYAVPGRSESSLRTELWEQACRAQPDLAGATVIDDRFLLRQDCPLVGTDPWRSRPGVQTPDPRVVLAGDGVRCALPVALMERAAVTGFQAANHLLTDAGLPGHDLWSPPTRGLLAAARLSHRTRRRMPG